VTSYVIFGRLYRKVADAFPEGVDTADQFYKRYEGALDCPIDDTFDPEAVAIVADRALGNTLVVGLILGKWCGLDERTGIAAAEVRHYHEIGVDLDRKLKKDHPELEAAPGPRRTGLWAVSVA
jgi:hypothetical protein